ncbi:MAG TPA: 3-oxoacyl-ACP reductase family protein [Acidobacteriaceae bacterium]|nr:3-oxoacyl-ACP reductase family protein [Acidobacteriaceae bacterium]
MESLHGKVSLVTGSSRGIGAGAALALADAGADVAVNFLSRADEAEAVARKVREMGRRCVSVQADVSCAEAVKRLVETVEEQLGSVDILINNAGAARAQPMEEITEGDWDEIVDANLKSCFLLTQAVVAGMKARRWGRIVNLSSVAAHIGGIVGPHYAASKAGMLGLTHYYARHLGPLGITVNAISPALIETEMVTSNPNATPNLVPMGRYGSVEEVADVVVMLAGNGYVNGQTIHVNGGWFMT